MTKKCPFCNSKDYEYYSMRNIEKNTGWIEHRCLKCNRKWRYRKGEIEEIK